MIRPEHPQLQRRESRFDPRRRDFHPRPGGGVVEPDAAALRIRTRDSQITPGTADLRRTGG